MGVSRQGQAVCSPTEWGLSAGVRVGVLPSGGPTCVRVMIPSRDSQRSHFLGGRTVGPGVFVGALAPLALRAPIRVSKLTDVFDLVHGGKYVVSQFREAAGSVWRPRSAAGSAQLETW